MRPDVLYVPLNISVHRNRDEGVKKTSSLANQQSPHSINHHLANAFLPPASDILTWVSFYPMLIGPVNEESIRSIDLFRGSLLWPTAAHDLSTQRQDICKQDTSVTFLLKSAHLLNPSLTPPQHSPHLTEHNISSQPCIMDTASVSTGHSTDPFFSQQRKTGHAALRKNEMQVWVSPKADEEELIPFSNRLTRLWVNPNILSTIYKPIHLYLIAYNSIELSAMVYIALVSIKHVNVNKNPL